ncbi:DNA modification methylase [Candidatus Azambacteria bacterium RIFCSPLOWO2_02_FULL_44_14]|uniref:Methyltransferase n=1 Tax=Candidatus Azambacteria bacterium RIFCSPLOWO2_02_FULL_44_14 TaxID=1797306 RepID=A0A1F5CC82_9BACT|nr:MAG: DNA modification methylase [Candidatus Azambacteria bacterium RIFCSPLOWO2_02_FULL_44_14]
MKKNSNKIMVGDALSELKKLPDNSIDVGVTSPPYNKQENKKGWLVKNVKYDAINDKKDELVYQNEQIAVLNELYRVIKEGGHFFYNHKTRWERGEMLHPLEWILKTNWTVRQEIIWDRGIAANIRGWRFWQVDERMYWLYKPRAGNKIGDELESRHALLTSIWRIRPEGRNPHPAPFPLTLPIRCIYSVLGDRKGLVIDPYCGSGTTLVAADLLGHSYVGIDISKEYIGRSKNRVKNSQREINTLSQEKLLHVVEKTFKERKARGEFVGKFRNLVVRAHTKQSSLFS